MTGVGARDTKASGTYLNVGGQATIAFPLFIIKPYTREMLLATLETTLRDINAIKEHAKE